MELKAARQQLRAKGWLASMSEQLQEEFLSRGRIKVFGAGDFVFHIGDEPGGMFGILEGTFGVVVTSGDEMVVCHLLRPGG